MKRGITSLALGIAAVSVLSPRQALADQAADTASARILGGDGVLLADAGDCTQAIEKLARAETLHHAPTTAARLGECEIAVGRLVAGTERLYRVIREPMPDGASAASAAAIARARTVLEQALPRIPTVRVTVVAPAGAHFTVTLDGEALPEAMLGSDRPTDPKTHRLQITGEGFLSETKDFALAESEARKVVLHLEVDPSAKVVAAQDHEGGSRAPAPPPTNVFLRPATLTAIGVGALGLGFGTVGGVLVATRSADLSKSCTGKVCPSDKESEISSAKSWATISTIGFAVAAAGLGTAAVLIVMGHKESGPSAEAQIGPTYVGLSGRF